jgi:drug/metabolite transporter (DMT)-like permease
MTAIGRTVAAFSAMPGNARGVIWMILAALFYACTYGVVRYLSESFVTFQIVFFRSSLGLVFMLPWAIRAGIDGLKTTRTGLYVGRTVLNYFGMVTLMWGIAMLPLQDVTALMFTSPLFTVLFVALILGEHVGLRRWSALIVGFAGALVIIRPGFQEVGLPAAGILFTAASYALVNTANKSLATTDDSNKIVFYMFALMVVAGIGPAIYVWRMPTLEHVPWILAMGAFSALATQCVVRSVAVGEAGAVMPFNFLKLPFSVVIGFAFWAEFPDLWTAAGALVIFSSTYYIARREAALKKVKAGVETTAPVPGSTPPGT